MISSSSWVLFNQTIEKMFLFVGLWSAIISQHGIGTWIASITESCYAGAFTFAQACSGWAAWFCSRNSMTRDRAFPICAEGSSWAQWIHALGPFVPSARSLHLHGHEVYKLLMLHLGGRLVVLDAPPRPVDMFSLAAACQSMDHWEKSKRAGSVTSCTCWSLLERDMAITWNCLAT